LVGSHRPSLSHYGKLGKHNSTVPLPFVTAPEVKVEDVGDASTGILQFPVFNALLTGERIMLDQIGYQSTVTEQTHRLAQVIREMDDLPEATANLVAARLMARHIGIPVVLEPLEDAIRLREHRLIRDIDNLLSAQNQAQVTRLVTAGIVYRLGKVDPDCAKWTDEDTDGLTEGLRDAVYAFMLREQRGGAAPVDPAEMLKAMAENLGKPNLPQPTGAQSSGDSTTSGPTTPPSPASDSPGAQKTSSGRRSKKGLNSRGKGGTLQNGRSPTFTPGTPALTGTPISAASRS
jgi:hypothetical protein